MDSTNNLFLKDTGCLLSKVCEKNEIDFTLQACKYVQD